jgi:hypothetical protein
MTITIGREEHLILPESNALLMTQACNEWVLDRSLYTAKQISAPSIVAESYYEKKHNEVRLLTHHH